MKTKQQEESNSLKKLDSWISVNDSLPEPKVPVLVLFKHRVTLAAIEEKEDEFIELGKFRVWKALKLQNDDIYEAYPWKAITHWMPLPKLPEEK